MKYSLTILILLLFVGCKSEPDKKIGFSLDDIMAVYQNGYLKGEINALSHNDTWILDSITIRNKFEPLYK